MADPDGTDLEVIDVGVTHTAGRLQVLLYLPDGSVVRLTTGQAAHLAATLRVVLDHPPPDPDAGAAVIVAALAAAAAARSGGRR